MANYLIVKHVILKKKGGKNKNTKKPKAAVRHPLNGGVCLGAFINRYYAKHTARELGFFFSV